MDIIRRPKPQTIIKKVFVRSGIDTVLRYLFFLELIVVIAVGAYLAYHEYQLKQKSETQQIVERLKRTVDLPNETPVLATVTDKNSLEKNAFFSKAENGDKVIIYTKSQRALLYRPSTGKIIEITVIQIKAPNS